MERTIGREGHQMRFTVLITLLNILGLVTTPDGLALKVRWEEVLPSRVPLFRLQEGEQQEQEQDEGRKGGKRMDERMPV